MTQPEEKADITLSYEQHKQLADLVGPEAMSLFPSEEDRARMVGNVENGTIVEVTVDALVRAGGVVPDDKASVLKYAAPIFRQFNEIPDDEYDQLDLIYTGTRLSRLFGSWQEYTREITSEAVSQVARVDVSRRFAKFMVSKSAELIASEADTNITEFPREPADEDDGLLHQQEA